MCQRLLGIFFYKTMVNVKWSGWPSALIIWSTLWSTKPKQSLAYQNWWFLRLPSPSPSRPLMWTKHRFQTCLYLSKLTRHLCHAQQPTGIPKWSLISNQWIYSLIQLLKIIAFKIKCSSWPWKIRQSLPVRLVRIFQAIIITRNLHWVWEPVEGLRACLSFLLKYAITSTRGFVNMETTVDTSMAIPCQKAFLRFSVQALIMSSLMMIICSLLALSKSLKRSWLSFLNREEACQFQLHHCQWCIMRSMGGSFRLKGILQRAKGTVRLGIVWQSFLLDWRTAFVSLTGFFFLHILNCTMKFHVHKFWIVIVWFVGLMGSTR